MGDFNELQRKRKAKKKAKEAKERARRERKLAKYTDSQVVGEKVRPALGASSVSSVPVPAETALERYKKLKGAKLAHEAKSFGALQDSKALADLDGEEDGEGKQR